MKINNPDYLVIIKQTPDPGNPGVQGATVVAPLPETMAYDTSSEYATPFAQGMLSGMGNLSQMMSAAGVRLTTQAMTAQLWQGATENDLGLELEFQTDDDPEQDVLIPIKTLMKLAAASVDAATGLLKSPGPRISLEDTGKIVTNAGSQLTNSLKQTVSAAGAVVGAVSTNKGLNAQNSNLNATQSANGPPPVENGLGGAQYWKKVIRNQISIQVGSYAFFDSVVILNVQETWSHEIDARTGLPLHAKASVRFKPLFLVTQEDLDKIFSRRG
jgi:hypothetical protein